MSVLATGMVLAGRPLAQNNFGDTEGQGMAGPLGLVVIVLLAIATVLLIRNMNRRLRHLPGRFSTTQESDTALSSDDVSRQDHSHQDRTDQGEVVGEDASERHPEASDDRR